MSSLLPRQRLNFPDERFRFSLRSLCLAFSALAIALGVGIAWWRYHIRQLDEVDVADKMSRCVSALWLGGQQWESLGASHKRVRDACSESLYSWRLTIGASTLLIGNLDFVDLDKRWDSGAYAMHDSDAKFYRLLRHSDGKTATRIVGITGPGTAFDAVWRSATEGIITPPRDAILLLDTAQASHHWMAPGDLDVRSLDPEKPDGGLPTSISRQGRFIAFADGVVWMVSHEAPVEAILKFTTVEGASKYDRNEVLGPYVLLEEVYRQPYDVEWP